MAAFYNEIDPKAAAWLRELIKGGHIADGEVDERDIQDIRPADLSGFTQCHFFAGIGVWSYALRCAGWPDDRPVWTGSCPCQPFSAAGKGGGFDDERHLWPAFHWLIGQCRPPVVLGEQVASKDGLAWLDLVQADLEGTGYASGAVDTCAAGVGAPHIRQRLYWAGKRLADASGEGLAQQRSVGRAPLQASFGDPGEAVERTGAPGAVGLADAGLSTAERQRSHSGEILPVAKPEGFDIRSNAIGGLAVPDDPERRADLPSGHDGGRPDTGRAKGAGHVGIGGSDGGLADAAEPGWLARGRDSGSGDGGGSARLEPRRLCDAGRPGPTNGLWRDADWLFCRDGKWRPVEPGAFPLAHGAPERVGRLRGYGNAIVAPAAQAFIEAYLEAEAVRAP